MVIIVLGGVHPGNLSLYMPNIISLNFSPETCDTKAEAYADLPMPDGNGSMSLKAGEKLVIGCVLRRALSSPEGKIISLFEDSIYTKKVMLLSVSTKTSLT